MAEMTIDQLKAKIAELEASNAAMQISRGMAGITIGKMGGIVFTGTGAHPWAPYLSQLLPVVRCILSGKVESFVVANFDKFTQKETGSKITIEDVREAFTKK
jgi:hypothetical protein